MKNDAGGGQYYYYVLTKLAPIKCCTFVYLLSVCLSVCLFSVCLSVTPYLCRRALVHVTQVFCGRGFSPGDVRKHVSSATLIVSPNRRPGGGGVGGGLSVGGGGRGGGREREGGMEGGREGGENEMERERGIEGEELRE